MIDGHFKKRLDRVWNYLARAIVRVGISANQVTLAGLIFMLLVCLVYPFWQNQVGFALVILLFFAFDSLDGAVARITDTCSDFGGYLDAMVCGRGGKYVRPPQNWYVGAVQHEYKL